MTLNISKGNELYKNREWLIKKYAHEKINMRELAPLAGCCYVTLWSWMNKLKIERRRNRENVKLPPRKFVYLDADQNEFIDGLLLGDGSIYTQGKNSNRVAIYGHADKHIEYVIWLYEKFKKMGFKCGRIRPMRNGYQFKTLSYSNLYNIHCRWYPDGKKIFPTDLKLTPTLLKNWFVGDGNYSKDPLIDSVCFSLNSIKEFVQPLVDMGINYTLRSYDLPCGKTRKRIRVAAASRDRFINYILSDDPEIPPGYEYKFKKVNCGAQ